MIELQTAYMRAYLEGINQRITHATDTLDWAHGAQTLLPEHLIPPFPLDSAARAAAESDWRRYTQQVQGLGPRILKTKRTGAVGNVNWGGDNLTLDGRLETKHLRALMRTAFDPLACNGITSAWAFQDEITGRNRMQVLGGYLEPIYREDDPTGDVIGLYQVTQDPDQTKIRYRARVYGFEDRSIREWRDLRDPTRLDNTPTNEWANTSVPRVVTYDTNHDGYPIGELAQALNVLRAEVSAQLRILRVADAQAWGILTLAGPWDAPREMGATTVLKSPEPTSRAERIEPASLEQLFILHDRTMERIRADQFLPIASIGTGGWPSGEALQQANIGYISNANDYAIILSELATGIVADWAALEGINDPPPVTISINREQMRATVSHQVREDYFRGIVSLRMAVTAVSPYYPDTDSEEIEAFITAYGENADATATNPNERLPAVLVEGDE